MNAGRGQVGHVAMAGVLLGMVAGLALPRLESVQAAADPPGSQPVESGPPAVAEGEPVTTLATTEATETTVETSAPPTTAPQTTASQTSVEAPANSVVAEPADSLPSTLELEDLTFGVTVEPVCVELIPAVDVTSTGTGDVRVAIGPESMVLTAAQPTWRAPWPTIDGEPDTSAKWDAVRVDTTELIGNGVITLPADCPPPPIVPSAPDGLTATPSNTSVSLQWLPPASDGGSPITDYIVEQSPDGITTWTTVNDGDGDGANTSATITGLTNGTLYYFRILATNANGTGPPSIDAKVTPRTVPSAPLALAAAPTNLSGQLRLAWAAPASDGGSAITDYIVHRSPNGTSNWTLITDGVSTATAFTATGLTNGTRYYFRVYPVNAAGTGAVSGVVNAIPRSVPSAPRTLAAAPTNVSGQIRLTWLAPLSAGGSAITDYVIQRWSSGVWVTISDGVTTATAYTVTGLANGTRYYLRVQARNVVGLSPASNTANAIPRTKPTAPRSLAAAATGASGQIRLTWVAPSSNGGSAITDYIIQRSPNGTTWTTINDGVRSTTGFTATGLANGTRYYFRVFARNVAGQSPASNTTSAIPRYVLTAPRSLTATPGNRSVRLSWTVPLSNGGSTITDYIIQRSPNGSTGWVTIADGVSAATTRTVTGLANGTRYYFRVYAKTARATSPASNIANAIPRTVPSAPRSPAAAPTNVSGQIRLTWAAPASNGGSAITDYIIQRSPNGSSGWVTINDGVRNTTGYTVGGLANGTRYYFRVFARNVAGQSPASAAVSAIARTVPSQPSYIYAEASVEGFYVEWGTPSSTGGSSITSYVIQAYDYDTATWFTLIVVGPSVRALDIAAPGFGCGAFRVAATNAAGRGPFIGPVEVCFLEERQNLEGSRPGHLGVPRRPAQDGRVGIRLMSRLSRLPTSRRSNTYHVPLTPSPAGCRSLHCSRAGA